GYGEEGERAGVGDRRQERGRVAHTGHRTLEDGEAKAVLGRERGAGRVGCGRERLTAVAVDRAVQAAHQVERARVALGERAGERGVLAGGEQALVEVAHAEHVGQRGLERGTG